MVEYCRRLIPTTLSYFHAYMMTNPLLLTVNAKPYNLEKIEQVISLWSLVIPSLIYLHAYDELIIISAGSKYCIYMCAYKSSLDLVYIYIWDKKKKKVVRNYQEIFIHFCIFLLLWSWPADFRVNLIFSKEEEEKTLMIHQRYENWM